jgi:hypothetical protein
MGKVLLSIVSLLSLMNCVHEPTTVTGGPQFTFANNPDNGNPRIIRFGDRIGFLLVDPATNLFSLQAGTNRQFGCVSPPTYLTFHDVQQHLQTPDDPLASAIHELRILKDAYLAVYQGPYPFTDCADLASRKIAEGIGSFRNTDNDLVTFLRDHNNYNAFGFVAQGRLQRVDGAGAVQYNGVSRCVWDGVDGTEKFHCKDKINLH